MSSSLSHLDDEDRNLASVLTRAPSIPEDSEVIPFDSDLSHPTPVPSSAPPVASSRSLSLSSGSQEILIPQKTVLNALTKFSSSRSLRATNSHPSSISPGSGSGFGSAPTPPIEHRGTIMKVLSRFSSTASDGPSHSRHTLLRMFSVRPQPKAQIASSTTGKRMLTCGQLSDLFRRLDKDGNGELDLEEFTQIINKLKINASEDFVARVFRKVDVAKSGTLDLQEFVSAYQMIFTRPSSFMGNNLPDQNLAGKKVSEFICAVRYGIDSDEKPLYELYLGKVLDLPDGPLFLMDEKRMYHLDETVDQISDLKYDVVPGWTGGLADLNELVVRDSMSNKMGKAKIFWWIDVAMTKVASHRVDKYIAGLGLPNDSKFRSAFGQFGTCLPKEEKSHIYAGNGTSNLGGVSSLSVFVQALWILSLPIVHHLPAWLDNALEIYCSQSIKNSIKHYYYSRFAFLLNASKTANSIHEEFTNAFDNAQLMADRLDDTKDQEDEDDEPIGPVDKVNGNILLPAPLSRHRQSKWASEPTWLISGSELKKRAPKLQFDDLSLHILNQGHGPSSVLTIREIDNEKESGSASRKNPSNTIVEDSKCGIIGRILTGIRICLLKNLCREGIVSVAGELTDSPGSLTSVIITLIQSFSMNTQGSLDTWLNLISQGVGDLAVSKHSAHAKELGNLIHLLRDYVEPTHEIIEKLYREGAQTLAEEALAEEQALIAEEEAIIEEEKNMREHLESINDVNSSSSSSENEVSEVVAKSPSLQSTYRRPSVLKYSNRKLSVQSPPKKAPLRKTVSLLRRRTGMTAEIQLSFATLSPGVQNIPINFAIVRGFFGTAACQNLGMILEGDESLEVKGTKYWSEQLGLLNNTFEKVKEDIRISLEEKRNFFSFILTTVTVGLAPLTILTGYWGMNFDNMWELDPEHNPDIPGVKLMWVASFFVYCAFLIMSIHFRILYSAT